MGGIKGRFIESVKKSDFQLYLLLVVGEINKTKLNRGFDIVKVTL